MMKTSLAIALTAISMTAAKAACICQCVNGQMQQVCRNATDPPRVCPPTICPITSPSLPPVTTPRIPPIGASECHQERICNTVGNCRWQQVCQ